MFLFYSIIPVAVVVAVVLVIGYGIRSSIRRSKKGKQGGSKVNNDEVITGALFLLVGVLIGMFLFTLNAKLQNLFEPLTILLVSGVVSLALAAFFRQLILSVGSIIALFSWIQIKASLWVSAADSAAIDTVIVMILASLLLVGVGLALRSQKDYQRLGITLLVLGMAPILFALVVVSTKSGLRAFEYLLVGKSLLASTQALVTVCVLSALGLFMSIWHVMKRTNLVNGVVLFASTVVSLGLLFIPTHSLFVGGSSGSYYSGGGDLSSAGVMWAFVFNIVLVALLVWFIYSGFKRGNTGHVNLGVAMLFILAVIKYFEWLASFMERSIFFIVTGVVFILIGWLMERGRRYLVGRIRQQTVGNVPMP